MKGKADEEPQGRIKRILMRVSKAVLCMEIKNGEVTREDPKKRLLGNRW